MYYEVVVDLIKLAHRTGKPLSQIAMNWMVRDNVVTSIIAGAQNVTQPEENLGAVEWTMEDSLYNEIEEIVANSGLDL